MSDEDRFSIRTVGVDSGSAPPAPELPAQAAVASSRQIAEE
jgi:hypothetical protein